MLKKYLLARGLTLKDFGALTKDPADDYPDFVLPAAQAVADGRAEFGLLVCTSGVGIYIAANKIPGVRAGQAFDEKARGADAPAQRRERALSRRRHAARNWRKKFSTRSWPRNSKAAATNAASTK